MGVWAQIPGQDDGELSGARRLLADLLRKRLVDAVLVPKPAPGGDNLVQTLIERTEFLADADPVAPVMPVQSARIVSALTAGGAPYRLAAVLKACEVRATIELAKLRQVDLTATLLIGVDCLGTYEVSDYGALVRAGADPTAQALAAARSGALSPLPGAAFRTACQMCERPVSAGCQLAIRLLGTGGQVWVEGSAELIGSLGYDPAGPPPGREESVAALISERTATRDRLLAEYRGQTHDLNALLSLFSRCIRCHNCMVNCPICYCKECIFRTAVFDHPPSQYLTWLQRRGVVRLPADTLLFHLTRLNHMATSCVGCGLCSSACPSHLPVAELFRAVGMEVQALFGYEPGRSLEDELPVASFREDELPGVAR